MSDSEWFNVVCFYVARINGEVPEDALYEEIHYLVRCESIDAANESAAELARAGTHSYENMNGDSVSWEPAGQILVKEVETPLVSGAEVFSRFLDQATFRALAESGG